MRIEASAVALSGNRTYLEKYERSESLRIWTGNQRPDSEDRGKKAAPSSGAGALRIDTVDLSAGARQAQAMSQPEGADETFLRLTENDKLKIRLIEKLIEGLTGKKVKIRLLEEFKISRKQCDDPANAVSGLEQPNTRLIDETQHGWGIEYDYHESRYEREATTFSAQGIIRTADGEEIAFSADISMTREFMMEQNLSIRAGDARKIDPLVLNFGGNAAQLTTTRFSFDIDSDGTDEQIPFVAPGGGFLSLDSNGDGVINNGSELFGPTTGNGFGELSVHDADANGWIDENDPVFSRLRVWSRDGNGNQSLAALGQYGIGAIYLGHVSTPFSITGADNQSLGSVSTSGIFLKESGTAGVVQQIDLTV